MFLGQGYTTRRFKDRLVRVFIKVHGRLGIGGVQNSLLVLFLGALFLTSIDLVVIIFATTFH